jgi:hypothetical protein
MLVDVTSYLVIKCKYDRKLLQWNEDETFRTSYSVCLAINQVLSISTWNLKLWNIQIFINLESWMLLYESCSINFNLKSNFGCKKQRLDKTMNACNTWKELEYLCVAIFSIIDLVKYRKCSQYIYFNEFVNLIWFR